MAMDKRLFIPPDSVVAGLLYTSPARATFSASCRAASCDLQAHSSSYVCEGPAEWGSRVDHTVYTGQQAIRRR